MLHWRIFWVCFAFFGVLFVAALYSYQTVVPLGQAQYVAFPRSSPAPPQPEIIRIQFFGDMMLGREVANKMGTSGLAYLFKNVSAKTTSSIFTGANIVTANLEGPFAPYRINTTKSIAFRFKPELAGELQEHGFSVFNLANNHALDMGRANAAFTKKVLAENGLLFFGDQLQEGPEHTLFVGKGTIATSSLAFVGINATAHQISKEKIKQALVAAESGADYTIVNIHWGVEYDKISNHKERDLAHYLIDNGAEAVVGHHPHVIQEMEIYKDKPIFYSLGNFIFDQYFSKDTQEGLSVELTFVDGEVDRIKLVPFYSVKSQLFLMEGKRLGEFFDWFENNSRIEDYSLENMEIILRKY
jgi:gamma-polyglutamate biosynthesis protein CapA